MARLCLICCSSPSPKGGSPAHTTVCCSRPICADCIQRTPRLRDYNPCLSCLAGVNAVRRVESRSADGVIRSTPETEQRRREQEMFVLGDSDDDDESPARPVSAEDSPTTAPAQQPQLTAAATAAAASDKSSTYWLQRGDTLQGLAFRFRVSAIQLCTLNDLPLSTLSTTPHLLHTRRSIQLPNHATNLQNIPTRPDPEQELERQRERAEKRFQFVTKEADWRVARAYVAIAEDDDDDADGDAEYSAAVKAKEAGNVKLRLSARSGPGALEGRALDRYLDDNEWEQTHGSSVEIGIVRFPNESAKV